GDAAARAGGRERDRLPSLAAAEALLIPASASLPRAMRALLLAAVLVAVPCVLGGGARAAGGLTFGSAAPVDPLASSIQPNLPWDGSGGLWLSSFAPGHSAFVRRSTDGGLSFRALGATTLPPTGGVDVAAGGNGV